jgi:hypothetical protein
MSNTSIRTKHLNGHVSHWWQALSAVPHDKDSAEYERLQRVWFDHTRFRGACLANSTPDEYAVKRQHEFLKPDHETHLTVCLWENFSIFEASEWLPRLFEVAALPPLPTESLACQWSYEWVGYRPSSEPGKEQEQGMCDVVVGYERGDGIRGVLVVEAKNLRKEPGAKELRFDYYLAIDEIAAHAENAALIYLVDESVREKSLALLGALPSNIRLITWQQLAGLQIELAKALAVPPTIRNFVAGAIQFQFAQHDIRPSRLSAPYLEEEMSMIDMDALPKPEKQSMTEHSKPLWRLSEPNQTA